MATAAHLVLALVAITSGAHSTGAGSGRISGSTLSPARHPVANVRVTLVCPPMRPQRVLSGADGRFEFRSPEGNCRVMAEKRGYVHTAFDGPPTDSSYGIAVRAGSTHDGIELTMIEGAVVTGTITGPGWSEAGATRVNLVRRDVTNGVVKLVAIGGGTAPDGNYRTATVPPGDYYVRASPPPPGSPGAKRGIAPTYFPGTTTVSDATLITLKAGDEREASFALARARTFTIAGIVQDASGNPVGGAHIGVTGDGDPPFIRGAAQSGRDGRFTIAGLVDGRYIMRALRRVDGEPEQLGELSFVVDGADLLQLAIRTAPRR